MTGSLPTVPYWQPALGCPGEVVEGLRDIAQCIELIATTPLGSVPLLPILGADLLAYLDRSAPTARRRLEREIQRALRQWEPRIESPRVLVRSVPGWPEHVVVVVTWKPRGGEEAVVQVLGIGGGMVETASETATPAAVAAPTVINQITQVQGGGGTAGPVTATLTEALPALTAVRIVSGQASKVTSADATAPQVDGVTLEAGGIGQAIKVGTIQGQVYQVPAVPSGGTLWLSKTGTLQAATPSAAAGDLWLVEVGRTAGASAFVLDPDQPIRLAVP